jgi:hypothetical protein
MKTHTCLFLIAALPIMADEATVAPYELKTRSSFAVNTDARTPFWPIGWVKPKVGQAPVTKPGTVVKEELPFDAKYFQVTSVYLGSPSLATINGRSFAQGEYLPVSYKGQRLKVMVHSIRDGGVVLQHENKTLLVPIRREQLNSAGNADQTLPSQEFQIEIGGDQAGNRGNNNNPNLRKTR